MKKKILSLILAFTVMATSAPISNLAVYAENFTDEEIAVSDVDAEAENGSTDDETADLEETAESEEESNSETDSSEDVEDLEEDFSDSENDTELTIEPEENKEKSEEVETDIIDGGEIDSGESQQAGSSEEYTYGDYKYTVSGDKATIIGYTGKKKEISIPDEINGHEVTTIGLEAFRECSTLEKIYIPENVIRIENDAFYNCKQLNSVKINDSVEKKLTIGCNVFSNCTSLKEIILPERVTQLGEAFISGTNITSITIPKNLQRAEGYYLYSHKGALTGADKLEEVIFEEGIKRICDQICYENKTIKKVIIPDSVEEIGSYAFVGCASLEKIELPTNLTVISDEAFNKCTALEYIDIPASVTWIGSSAFEGCTKLNSVNIENNEKNELKIYNHVFSGCQNLTELLLPERVTYLGIEFVSGTGITSIVIPKDLKGADGYELYGRYYGSLAGANKLEKVVFEEGTTTIFDKMCAGNMTITKIEIPKTVQIIKNYAFYGCTELEEISIPQNVVNIGSYAFSRCRKLSHVQMKDNKEEELEICDHVFTECLNLKELTLPKNVIYLGEKFISGTGITSIVIPKSIKRVGTEWDLQGYQGVLAGAYKLKEVIFEKGTKTIYNSICCKNTEIKKVEIPKTVKSIGSEAFRGCTGLEGIEIPESVTSIRYNAFSGCTSLTIYGYTGSYAETYASEQNIPFVSIGVAVNVEEYDYSSKLDQWLLDQGTSNAMNYLVKDMNFTNSAAVATFDSDFGSRVTEAWSNMLFRGASGWKEIFTRATSREQARDILIALLEEQSEQIELLTKVETAKKYASIFVSTFKQANWAYALDYGLSNDEVQYLAKLCTEDKIADFFVKGKYETISAYLQVGEKIPENSKVIKCIETYSKSTKLLNACSSVLDWAGALVKFEKMTAGTLKALYNIDSLWKADEMYAEMLGYIRDNCPYVPVSQAAADLYNVIQGGYVSALSYAATSINNTVSDTVIEAAVSSLIKKLPYGALINTTYHFSVGVANILFNTADTQKQRDNMRCIAYIGSYISKWMVNCRLQYLTGNTEDKQENARKTVYAYYMLLKTRMAGEQSLQSMMKSGKMAWKRAYAVSKEISETLKSNEKWLEASGVLSEISTSVVACPVNVEVRNSAGKLILTIYDGKETEGYIGDIYYSAFYNPISKDYTKIVRLPVNGGYSLKCTGTDLGVVDYYQTTISDDGGTTQQEVNNIPVQKNSQVIISENKEKQPVCTLKEGNKEIKKYIAKTSTSSNTYIPVTGIKVTQSKMSLKVGDKQRINTTISPDNASTQGIQWTSSADGIVSVNSDGVITANKKGTAVITAKAVNDNVSTKIQVTVAEKTTVYSGKFTVKLSGTTYAYNGKTQKPKVKVTYKGKVLSSKYYTVVYKNNKNIGTATVTVKGKGNYKKCSGKATFKIVLKKSTLSSLKAGKKSATVSWKTVTGSTGYQIQYSTNKNFSKSKIIKVTGAGKKSTTIKKLTSKKNYYVRVRAYKTVNKKAVYGAWSSSKKTVVK